MAKQAKTPAKSTIATGRPSSLVDTRIIYCGDCLDQLRKLPDACVGDYMAWNRIATGEPNRNRNYEVFCRTMIRLKRPSGASECSHGWSEGRRQATGAQPVEE